MNRQKRKELTTTSRFFSIESYFKSTQNTNDNKRIKVEEQVKDELTTKGEKCPICCALIPTESVSLEVHVNLCLDSQQETNQTNSLELNASLTSNEYTPTLEDDVSADDLLLIEEAMVLEKEALTKQNPNSKVKQETLQSISTQEYLDSKNTMKKENQTESNNNSWKEKFAFNAATPLKEKNVNVKITPTSKKPADTKPCPFYKRVRDTRFFVDAFKYGQIPDCDGYFLTHYHSDHYGGLRASWSHGTIYCSQVTANLVKQELRVNPQYVHALPMNELVSIPGSNIAVALIDANHCPGSVLFLFIIDNKIRHLHTGDFRAAPRMCLHPMIRQPENPPIHSLYLDTTYLNPQYAFPAQEECIEAACNVVAAELENDENKTPSLLQRWVNISSKATPKKTRMLVVVGTYTIGKERVFINNPHEAQVHVVPLRQIRSDVMMLDYLQNFQNSFDRLIAFKPTGWTYKSTATETSDMKLAPLFHVITPPSDRSLSLTPFYKNDKIKLFNVPYSEHSSFRELASFIASLDIKHIIPTVNMHKIQQMNIYFERWQEEKRAKKIEVVAYPNEDHW
ncbi:DNA cross-link repair protein pso2/snm1 [Choanephora cucurbitarum]|uniref:DNA cross-link repair protein pso2/snm1 n=1 Tax=Choanephora cucurbitarum TaxID=101091 RepID=A0A1C7N0Y4_9FUNG|nr:DNA cross-link repair protein pso2/snm1 [Choanephora cucurbitarum]